MYKHMRSPSLEEPHKRRGSITPQESSSSLDSTSLTTSNLSVIPGSLQSPSTSGASSLDTKSNKTSDSRQSPSSAGRVSPPKASSPGSLPAVMTCAQNDITGLATPPTAPVSSYTDTVVRRLGYFRNFTYHEIRHLQMSRTSSGSRRQSPRTTH